MDRNDPTSSKMFHEAAEAAQCVANQLKLNAGAVADLANRIRIDNFHTILTCARGSSDHAALYGKYLFERQLGKPVSSFAPSIASLYNSELDLKGTLFIAISQSGGSPDLLASVEMAKQCGAYTVALTNKPSSPLGKAAHHVIALHAGDEMSVAATKSYICSLSVLADISFQASQDEIGGTNIQQLPALLESAWLKDWDHAIEALLPAQNLFVIGRGLGLSIAEEAALKFKETSGLHAEAYSAAEVKHGPMAIVSNKFPILAFAPMDESFEGFEQLIATFTDRGASCFVSGAKVSGSTTLDTVEKSDPRLLPIAQIQSFYRFANAYSLARGHNPDEPPFLKKVTETI